MASKKATKTQAKTPPKVATAPESGAGPRGAKASARTSPGRVSAAKTSSPKKPEARKANGRASAVGAKGAAAKGSSVKAAPAKATSARATAEKKPTKNASSRRAPTADKAQPKKTIAAKTPEAKAVKSKGRASTPEKKLATSNGKAPPAKGGTSTKASVVKLSDARAAAEAKKAAARTGPAAARATAARGSKGASLSVVESEPKKVASESVQSEAPRSGVDVGDEAPSFVLQDDSGTVVSSESLRGSPYVLYFYPKDDTPGCTLEACGFRDALPRFSAKGVRVLGVSPDLPETHARFKKKYGLTFPLLSDPEKTLAKAYGVWVKKHNYGREYMGIERSTFFVDKNGTIHRVWRGVKVPGHVDTVLDAV